MIKQLQPLINKSTKRDYKAGSTIIYQGEVPRSASILISGIVRVFSISPQGEEQIVTFHIAGEFFPMAWIFAKAPGTLFFYEALTDCVVAFTPRKDLKDFMTSDSEKTNTLLDYFATNYAASMIRVNALEQPKAREKLIYTLYYLTQRYGKTDTNKIKIPLELTHQNFASLVGLTRETTAIEMNKLKSEKIISYKQQEYIVDMEKLLEVLGEDSFKNLTINS